MTQGVGGVKGGPILRPHAEDWLHVVQAPVPDGSLLGQPGHGEAGVSHGHVELFSVDQDLDASD